MSTDIAKEPIPFRERWLRGIQNLFVMFPLLIFAPLLLGWMRGSVLSSLWMSGLFGLLCALNVVFTRRYYLYFITGIQILPTEVVLSFCSKDTPQTKTIPMDILTARLSRKAGKGGTSLMIALYENNQKILVQTQHESWSNEEIWKIYSEIQLCKEIAHTSMDEHLYRRCVEGRMW